MSDDDARAIRRRRDRLIALALSGAVGGLAGCGEEPTPVACLSPIAVDSEEAPGARPETDTQGGDHGADSEADPIPTACLTVDYARPAPEPADDDEEPPDEATPTPCLSPPAPPPGS